jgi:iron complex outermembrane receptor protein
MNKTPLSNFVLLIVCLPLSVWSQHNQDAATFLRSQSLEDLSHLPALTGEHDSFAALVQPKTTPLASGIVSQNETYAPAVTSIITAEDIEAMGATHLDDALRAVPGLYVDLSSIYESKYVMRGVGSALGSNAVIMLNGTPLQQLLTNSPLALLMHGGMPINNIARIEVTRGPGSALYGADAISGVINIITHDHVGIDGTQVGVRYGSHQSREIWALHGGVYQGVKLAGFFEFRETDGQQHIIEEELQTRLDRLNNTNYALAPAPLGSFSRWLQGGVNVQRERWQLRALHQIQRHGLGVGLRGMLEPASNRTDFHVSQLDLNFRDNDFARYWRVEAKASIHYFTWKDPSPRHFYVPPALGGKAPEVLFKESWRASEIAPHAQITALYTGWTDHALLFGLGYKHNQFAQGEQWVNFGLNPDTGAPLNPQSDWVNLIDSPFNSFPEGVRHNRWGLLQDTWTFAPHWTLTSGIRYDNFSDFGNVLSPRLSLVWQPDTRRYMKFFYGHAFQAPAYSQMYSTFDLFIGNPDLQATQADSLEWMFGYAPRSDLHANISVFAQRIRDQILYTPGFNRHFSNLGRSDYYGLEFEVRWKYLKSHSLLANYAHYRQNSDNFAQELKTSPRDKIYLRHDWQIVPRLSLNSQFYWAQGFQRSREDLRDEPSAQSSLDFNLRYKPQACDCSIAIGLRNALDRDNRDPNYSQIQGHAYFPRDYPMPRRAWWLELRYQF